MSAPSENDFIPYGCQEVTETDIKAVVDILKSQYLTQGPTVQKFEKEISQKVGAKFGVAVNSATSALHLACMALSLKKMIGYGLLQFLLLHLQIAVFIVEQKLIL